MKTNPMRVEIPMTGAMVRPGKVRLEMNHPMMSSQTISDGRNTWKCVARFQQYTRQPVSQGVFPMSDGPGGILAGENVLDRLQTAKLLRREKLSVDGQEVDCDVIEAEYSSKPGDPSGREGPKTFWVDRDRSVILKTSFLAKIVSPAGGAQEMTESITVTSIRLNQPVPESLFAFAPPEGAREVDELIPPGMKAPPDQGKNSGGSGPCRRPKPFPPGVSPLVDGACTIGRNENQRRRAQSVRGTPARRSTPRACPAKSASS
jgi:outer membrane lipoprotein-sorting protein